MNTLLSLLTLLIQVVLVSATAGIACRLIMFEIPEWKAERRIRQMAKRNGVQR